MQICSLVRKRSGCHYRVERYGCMMRYRVSTRNRTERFVVYIELFELPAQTAPGKISYNEVFFKTAELFRGTAMPIFPVSRSLQVQRP